MRSKCFAVLAVLLFCGLSQSAIAAPELIDYQGFLEDDNGNPITDTLSVTFTIYTASTGGTSKWTETQSTVAILGGLFNVSLGSSTAIPDTVFNDDTRYLAITIGGTELSPRTRIVSSAYAHRVNTVDGADGGTLTGDLTAGKGNFGDTNINSGLSAFVAGKLDTASGDYSVVAGGYGNSASGDHSTVGGGYGNLATDGYASVSGGRYNFARGAYSTICGGGGPILFDSNYTNGSYSAIGGGRKNRISTDHSVISGGSNNLVSGGTAGTISGGVTNEVSDDYGTIGGGALNTVTGKYSTVPGGYSNSGGANYTLAAGRRAKANQAGAFVWADSYDGDFASSAANQFNVRASGGVRIYTNSGLTAGVTMSAGGSSWSSVSDSTLKQNIRTVQGTDIIEKLMRLPLKQWSYKAQDESIEHIGPMAQDFYAIFGLGEDDKTISTIDPSGIALAAIQEVYRLTQQLQNKVSEIDDLKTDLATLQATVKELAKNVNTHSSENDEFAITSVDNKIDTNK